MDQEELKSRLITVIDSGLNARAIAKHIGIAYDTLSKYKQGRLYLCPEDANKLDKYLSAINIPTKF